MLMFALGRAAEIFFRRLFEFVAARGRTEVISLAAVGAGGRGFPRINWHSAHWIFGRASSRLIALAVTPMTAMTADVRPAPESHHQEKQQAPEEQGAQAFQAFRVHEFLL
jgi:hypothetical protein